MKAPPSASSMIKLVATLLIGLIAGGGSVFAVQTLGNGVASAKVDASGALELQKAAAVVGTQPEPTDQSRESHRQQAEDASGLSDREREVLKRLANLPDLPVVNAPSFDIKALSVPVNTSARTAKSPAHHTPAPPAAPEQPAGESVIARIQVVSVEKGRVFYRSVDDNIHTARAGERLLGINGRVLSVDEHGAELQIDGQRMRVAANTM
jgi:hypothetical protein